MEQFVKTCDQCQRAGKPNDKKKAPLKLVPVIQEVFTKLNIDACGPLPITSKGNRYLITAICMSSKFPEAIPVSDISSFSVTDALLNIFSRMGFPREIQCDQDAGSEWDKHLPSILLALRTVSHESTGYAPSELVYGKNLRTPETLVIEHWMEPEEEGLAGYYQKYINLFSVIAAPLTDALKGRAKKGEITWTTECENAFRELKGKLIDKPVLYAPNFEREFIVQTDASNAGMGAVLTQLTEQGEEHPILYLSKKFSEVEKRYCTTEKECASIVFAIKRLHYYLDGNSFLVMTDHNPLVWLNRNVRSNPRLMRWALALQPYNFRIVHRSGKSHKNADSLSRPVIDNYEWTVTAGSDVVQSGRPIFDDFFQHLWPYIGNNTANVVFQMVKRLWLIRIDQ
ncbi:retrovirus-related Pol polyprotein from transposon 297 [Trichonephila clavipes]|nr:retrovirus-related Pol polyprotein from transposon 297 [Trichonephila clavipes]